MDQHFRYIREGAPGLANRPKSGHEPKGAPKSTTVSLTDCQPLGRSDLIPYKVEQPPYVSLFRQIIHVQRTSDV